MTIPTEEILTTAIVDATKRAIRQLQEDYPDDTFYYYALITTGEGHTPCLTAWSKEKLQDAITSKTGKNESLEKELKWSYADSPFFPFGEEYFKEVERLFKARSVTGKYDTTTDSHELELRLRAMESAMAQLEMEGFFGSGQDRFRVVINAEVMPPDHTNVGRAQRLNPEEAIKDWLEEAGESPLSG